MTASGAGEERVEPWRRVAATLVDCAFHGAASAPGLLLFALTEPLALRATGLAVAGLLPLAAHFTANIALENMLGGWLLGVKVMRNSVTPVGAAGHMLRWWVMGFQLWVLVLVASVVGLPFRAFGEGPSYDRVVTVVEAVVFSLFVLFNLWLMTRGRGQTTWDRMLGTHVVRTQRAALAPRGRAVPER